MTRDCFHTTMVLTQPIRRGIMLDKYLCFHTTMVLTQQSWVPRSSLIGLRFHTTMVLTQRSITCKNRRQSSTFPYHYGSHATDYLERPSAVFTWCFHTTMVLTQRWPKPACKAIFCVRFHTTMVLTQPNTCPTTYTSSTCFHTTMVLTQQCLLWNLQPRL